MVTASGFEPDGRSSIHDTTKDPMSTCTVYLKKFPSSESPMVGLYHFTIWALPLKKFPSHLETNQNCEGGDGWQHHPSSKAEAKLLPL